MYSQFPGFAVTSITDFWYPLIDSFVEKRQPKKSSDFFLIIHYTSGKSGVKHIELDINGGKWEELVEVCALRVLF